MLNDKLAIQVKDLHFSYGKNEVLKGISFQVEEGTSFSLVGPNGSGKTTAFKILSSLYRAPRGTVYYFGTDWAQATSVEKKQIGILFQNAALDLKLTVEENLRCHGYLYSLRGKALGDRLDRAKQMLGLTEVWKERVETLSGGWRRRAELGKVLLTDPKILILDEATAGLDVVARREFWNNLQVLRSELGVTLLFTSHLLDEAESASVVAFIIGGKIIAQGTPDSLRANVGGDVISIKAKDPKITQMDIENRFGVTTSMLNGEIRIERKSGYEFIPQLVSAFSEVIQSITVGRPTLEDVFVQKTGQRLEAR